MKSISQLLCFALSASLTLSPCSAAGHGHNDDREFKTRCSRLSSTFHGPNTKVILSKYVTTGTNLTFPESAANTCAKFIVTLADICRLRLNTTTSSTSSVITEVFMPVDWESKGKKRFLMTGNGGLGGCIPYGDMVFGNKLGFAAVGHDNGHAGDTGLPFLNRPQVIEDYVYRGVLTATRIGKTAVQYFYRSTIWKAYFSGCSGGGRQGMRLAQDFPKEYNGILAVAPAIYSEPLAGFSANMFKATGVAGSPTFLTVDQWRRVHQMVIDQCDWIDGVLDNVLEDPMKCRPRPEALLCAQGQTWESHRCLTVPQVNTVKQLYSPLCGTDGKQIYPRWNPLTREFLGFRVIYGGVPSYFAEQWYQNAIYSDRSWTVANNFTLDTVAYANQLNLYGINTDKTDLTSLNNNGTKLLVYHGLTDGLISSEGTYQYYDDVVRDMGLRPPQLDNFFRFFPVSGLDHCYTGEGPWFVGGPVQTAGVPGAMDIDPSDGAIMKLVKWVERGEAPETLTGYTLVNGTVHGKREHCRYPSKTVYKGSGDPNLASSWKCSNAFA
ncbi:Tannase and feruloyl esterase [Orbilia brochopaga]|uniref:Carboxylic ester hydrolase n=1 Tax=Orbilia brochopaga TaxID=3140254 RepID=A0AAV9UPR3_9PEZI